MTSVPVKKDPFGFIFWLKWILAFAGSFVLAAVFWTAVLHFGFGGVAGYERAITWAVSVFGSWFVIVVPFMRKKERIWKRLNSDEEQAASLWLGAMSAFLLLMIAILFLWTWIYSVQISAPRADISIYRPWLKGVAVSAMAGLLPFLVWMYKRADDLYRHAELRQLARGPVFQSIFVERERRLLPDAAAEKLAQSQPLLRDGHIVKLTLKDGTQISDVFVIKNREILGLYGRRTFDFDVRDIREVEALEAGDLTAYQESEWLRLDAKR